MRNISFRTNTAALVLLSAASIPALALPDSWEEPSRGYQVVYEAADGVWPHETYPYWDIDPFRGDAYTRETSHVITDELTGEAALLMREALYDGWPSFSLAHSGGDGTPDDRMTIDFRFRLPRPEELPDDAPNHSGFRVNIWRPSADWQSSVRFAVTFYEDGIEFVHGAFAPFPVGTDWHDVRLTIDVAASVFSVYLDGSTEPVFMERGTPDQPAGRNWVLFGQQGPGVYGDVHLAYFKMTNNEIATEPDLSGDEIALEIREATVLEIPTEAGRHYTVTQTDDSGNTRWEHASFVGDGGSWREIASAAEAANFSATVTESGEWPAPEGGFTVSYSAEEGIVPYDSAISWGSGPFREYPDTHAYLVEDEITNEPVLHLNGVGAGSNSPTFTLDSGEGAGTASDKMTIDFRFRLVGETEGSLAQFRVGIWRPDPDASASIRYMVDFLQDEISFTGGPSIEYPVGTDWHDARITIDLVEKIGRLYLNGDSVPLLEFENGTSGQAASRNLVMFGHAAAAATGEARLAFFRFTNDDAAYPEEIRVPVNIQRTNDAIELVARPALGRWHRWETSADLTNWETDGDFFGTHSPITRLFDTGNLGDRQFFRLVQEDANDD